MRRSPPSDPYAEVEEFAERRQRDRGDLYGWTISDQRGVPVVVLLVSSEVTRSSFPKRIGPYPVRLRRVTPPEPQRGVGAMRVRTSDKVGGVSFIVASSSQSRDVRLDG